MSHRVNLMLSDSSWKLLQTLPKGERSTFVDKAISYAFALQDRLAAVAEMDRLRESTAPVGGCSEDWIREDRDNH